MIYVITMADAAMGVNAFSIAMITALNLEQLIMAYAITEKEHAQKMAAA
jgi:hypothetical protein